MIVEWRQKFYYSVSRPDGFCFSHKNKGYTRFYKAKDLSVDVNKHVPYMKDIL